MFSLQEKQRIAQAVEDVLKEINHPEMAGAPIRFMLHVDGAESWSWADIKQNIPETSVGVDPNPWNERSRLVGEINADSVTIIDGDVNGGISF